MIAAAWTRRLCGSGAVVAAVASGSAIAAPPESPNPSPASSTAGELAVETDSATGCFEAAALAQAIAAEYPAVVDLSARVALREESAQAVVVRIEAGEAASERRLTFADEGCPRRVATVALAVAVALEFLVELRDSEAAAGAQPEPEPKPESKPEPEPGPRPEPEPESKPEPEPKGLESPDAAIARAWPHASAARPLPTLALGPSTGFGVIPTGMFGLFVQPAIVWPRFALRLSARWLGGRTRTLAPGQLRTSIAVATPEGCARWRLGRGAVNACAGIEAGFLYGRGVGFDAPRTSVVPWIAPRGGVALSSPFTRRLALFAAVHAAVPLLRPRFVAGRETLQSTWVVGTASVGLAIAFARQ